MHIKYEKHDLRLAVAYITDSKFKPQHHHIFLLIATFLNDNYEFHWGKDSLSDLTRWSKPTIKRTIKDLSKWGYLKLVTSGHGRRQTNTYSIDGVQVFNNTSYRKGVSQTPFINKKGSHRPLLYEKRGLTGSIKGVSQTPESVIDSTEAHPPFQGVVASEDQEPVKSKWEGKTDEEIKTEVYKHCKIEDH